MIRVDENALICDLAETYNIYDYKQIAPKKVAIFAIGLKDDSRIKMKISDQRIDVKTLLLAKLVDNTNLLLWAKTDDAKKNINMPKSILKHLYEPQTNVSAFTSGKEFEVAKQRILGERRE